MHAPRPVRVRGARHDSSRHVTIDFDDPAITGYSPGQFVMVWVPGVDELPMALWGDGHPYRITVEAKGDGSKALCETRKGDLIGIRGPYGKGFTLGGKDLLFVAGGTGTAPLVPATARAVLGGARVRIALGGRSKEYLLLAKEFKEAGGEVHLATDDGSKGFHGRAAQLMAKLVTERRPDRILTCGPERMMRAVAEQAWSLGIPFEASLERWMKCATGICDACLVDGVRLCRDGPALDGTVLQGLADFGRFERRPDGRREPLR